MYIGMWGSLLTPSLLSAYAGVSYKVHLFEGLCLTPVILATVRGKGGSEQQFTTSLPWDPGDCRDPVASRNEFLTWAQTRASARLSMPIWAQT